VKKHDYVFKREKKLKHFSRIIFAGRQNTFVPWDMLVCLALSPRAGYTESPLFPNQVFTLHSFSNLDCKLFVSHIRLNSFFPSVRCSFGRKRRSKNFLFSLNVLRGLCELREKVCSTSWQNFIMFRLKIKFVYLNLLFWLLREYKIHCRHNLILPICSLNVFVWCLLFSFYRLCRRETEKREKRMKEAIAMPCTTCRLCCLEQEEPQGK
jgi:hypothetical protein